MHTPTNAMLTLKQTVFDLPRIQSVKSSSEMVSSDQPQGLMRGPMFVNTELWDVDACANLRGIRDDFIAKIHAA